MEVIENKQKPKTYFGQNAETPVKNDSRYRKSNVKFYKRNHIKPMTKSVYEDQKVVRLNGSLNSI